ncbi:chromatin modification- protein VID21, partial [Massospora cicadina]
SKVLRKRLVELESEFETAVRLASDPLELIEHLLGPTPNSGGGSSFKRQRTADVPRVRDAVLFDVTPKNPPEVNAAAVKQERPESRLITEAPVSLPSPKWARSSPIHPEDICAPSPVSETKEALHPREAETCLDVVSLPPEFVSPIAKPPLVHQGIFEALKTEQKKPEAASLSHPPKPATTFEIPNSDLSRNDESPTLAEAQIDSQPTTFVAPRTLEFSTPAQQRNDELKDMEPSSVQFEVAKRFNLHYGSQRAFNFRDISRRIHAFDLAVAKLNEKVERLISQNAWSYRQMRRQPGPQRPLAHWDRVLEEMQWLQADFVEEKKWKVHMASYIAHAVVRWHRSTHRASLCTRSYFRRDGTVNPNWVDPLGIASYHTNPGKATDAFSIFDVDPHSFVVAGQAQAYKDLPTYDFHVDNKAQYRDTLERGALMPITRLMETFVQFHPGTYTGVGNPSLGVDFQSYIPPPKGSKRFLIAENFWLDIEDQFLRKLAPELGFNWGLVAALLNSNLALAEHKRSAHECSARWSLVSNAVTEASSEQWLDAIKVSPPIPSSRFQILDGVKSQAQAHRKREPQDFQDMPQTPRGSPADDKPFLNVLDLIKAKMKDETLKQTLEPKDETTFAHPSIATSSATQAPFMLPRLAPAPSHPHLFMARPNFFPTLQNFGYMHNGLGGFLSAGRAAPGQMVSSSVHPGLQSFTPNINLGPFPASTANNIRMGFPAAPIPLHPAGPPIDLSTQEGRMLAAQLNRERDLILQRIIQARNQNNHNSQQGATQPSFLVEQQRQLARQIQESGANLANYPLIASTNSSASQIQAQQICPLLPNCGGFSNSHRKAASPTIQPPSGPVTSFLMPPPETPPKAPKTRVRAPRKTPVRKRTQKPALSETSPQPPTSTIVNSSPRVPSRSLQFMAYGSAPIQPPSAQIQFPNLHAQHQNPPSHLTVPQLHFQPRPPLAAPTLQFMPPQLGPVPVQPTSTSPASINCPAPLSQPPDCRKD